MTYTHLRELSRYMSNIVYIQSTSEFDKHKSSIYSNKYFGLDTETTSLKPKDGKLRLIQLKGIQDGNIYVIDAFKVPLSYLSTNLGPLLSGPDHKLIAHNFKFEYSWLLSKLGVRTSNTFDTYIADVMLDFFAKHSLAELVKRNLRVELDKTEQTGDWGANELSENQITYAALDTEHLYALREIQLEKLYKSGQIPAYSFEMDALPAIAEMELNGIPIDTEKYQRLINDITLERSCRADTLLDFLETRGGKYKKPSKYVQPSLFDASESVVSREININSWQQVLPIFNEMGIPISSTDANVLEPLLDQYPQIKLLLDYREYEKLCTTYGATMLERVSNGRLYSDFNQLGTITGRLSSRGPNLQNIPSTKKFRECFSTEHLGNGNKLVISDYSQFELRILADYARDEVMINAYRNGVDLHTLTTHNVFNVPIEEVATKHKHLRQAAKITNFSTVYGISPAALARRLKSQGVSDASEELASKLINGFLSGYKNAARWLQKQENSIAKTPYVTTVAGHKIPLKYDRNDKSSVRSAQRNARNYPIQSGNACAMKLALVRLTNDLNKNYTSAKVVVSVHDEVLVECSQNDAEDIKLLVEKHMLESATKFFGHVPIEAEAKICTNWGEK